MDDLTNFKQPSEKDWRDNIYTGPGMPSESAQRNERARGEGRALLGLVVFAALLVGGLFFVLRWFGRLLFG